MTREQFDNAVNEAVLALDDAQDLWRSKGYSEAVIREATQHANSQIQYNYCRFLKEESDARINEAVLALDDMEDSLRYAGIDESTIQDMYAPIYSQIQENAARASIRFAPITEAFSDTVFAGVNSAGVENVNRAGFDNFPRLGNPDSLTYDPSLYSQSVAVGNEPIMGFKEAGVSSIINKEALARMAYNEIANYGGYSAPEPKPSPEADLDRVLEQLLAM